MARLHRCRRGLWDQCRRQRRVPVDRVPRIRAADGAAAESSARTMRARAHGDSAGTDQSFGNWHSLHPLLDSIRAALTGHAVRNRHLSMLALFLVPACSDPVAPAPAVRNIVITAGDAQSGFPRAVLPETLGVRVMDDAGLPMRGVPVRWSASDSTAEVTP